MGMDVRIHSEVKIAGKWHHHCEFRPEQNYEMFEKMAGPVGLKDDGIVPISQPKGLPDDVSELTALSYEYWKGSVFAASWFGPDEIVSLYEFLMLHFKNSYIHQNFPYYNGKGFDGFVLYREDWVDAGVEDVRFVFWFDN